MTGRAIRFCVLLLVGAADTQLAAAALFELRPGDHISIIGNSLAERMQHDGWLEAELYSRFPKHDLVIRNLGFSGDELTLRLRSAGFGSPDEWLTRTKTDVVFAFFGYGESFADEAGLEAFKKNLADFIEHTRQQKYNGKSAPRLVVFSPIAHENLHDPNLPDGRENNRRLALYTEAMRAVCAEAGVPLVDLFHPTTMAGSTPRTINGIHLTAAGDKEVAAIIACALFGPPPADRPAELVERIRQAVVDKNFYWFQRYRTVDGYSIYGGRADLQFVDGQTNREVMQREMEVLDAMTANRDKRVWAVAAGGDVHVDDSNTPPFIPVKTNKPGPLPDGKHLFLDPEEAIGKMTVAKGMKVNLFASEKQFPELVNPVQMAWDPKGRLWVAVWPTYPHWKPKEAMNDKLLVFEDTDGDGRADVCSHFCDDLHCPTGFEFYNGGVLVAQAPYLMFLKDTDGDGRADLRQRLVGGLDSADTHHTANSFVLDPGGAVYFQEGTFHHTQVETPYGPTQRCANAGVFRFEPRTQKFMVYVTYGFANPHGHVFDRWGQDIVIDGTGANPYHAALFSGRLEFPEKHPAPPQVYQQRTRPCPGLEILSSRHFPEANQGNLLVGNVIGFQGILQYQLHDEGASFGAREAEPIVSSTDPNFRPSDIKVGPDGAIYFLDWHNPIIGHMQHNLRDPSRDREHGRVYRIVCEGRPLLAPVKIAGQPIAALLDLLKEPEDRVRYRARIELAARDSHEVIAQAKQWLGRLDPADPHYEHHRLEALWLCQSHNVVDAALLDDVLKSPDFRARAAATRVLCYWRDSLPSALDRLKSLAADPHPRVRLEAVRAASFFTQPQAIEVALISAEQAGDRYLDFVRGETMKALAPYLKRAIAEGTRIEFSTAAGRQYFLRNISTDDLLRLARTADVARELLLRPGVRDEFRRQGIAALAEAERKSEIGVLLDAITSLDRQDAAPDESVLFDLVRLLTEQSPDKLGGHRDELVGLATQGRLPLTRQLGYVALIAADQETSKAWELAVRSPAALYDLVSAMPAVRDVVQRATLYPLVEGLLTAPAKELSTAAAAAGAPRGRYVRIELPGWQRTLTLAEVEVYSAGRNVARDGKAIQKNTAHGGDAAKAIDGNRVGLYAAGGQTHSEENTQNPWWEVDLGAEFPIESITIYNRTDQSLGTRLEGFTLKLLDHDRKVIFQRDRLPAPKVRSELSIGGQSLARAIRWAAMRALCSVRGREASAFGTIAPFINNEDDRSAAIAALLRVPSAEWPADRAAELLDSIMAYIGKLPPEERTSAAAMDAMQLGEGLAGLLPADQARQVRRQLGELGVKVIRLGTVTDQMRYDKDQLVVQSGRRVEILFENGDIMPHNLVITEPGAMSEIGNLAEAMATQAGAAERGYIPDSSKILLASRLLPPRDSQRLGFVVPAREGVYPYVCTYPGHWRRMYGSLYVVDDLEHYLADPEAYIAAHKLVPADELLKYNRPRKEWKLEELAGAADQLEGRSFSNGKQLFQVANCVACHKLDGVGQQFGPDLARLDAKQTPGDILRSILEPAHKIDDKYASYVFELESGQLVTGMIVEETADLVKVIENPLANSDARLLSKGQIVSRTRSDNSIMPKNLLDRLSREEIIDLLAYVAARGDAQSPMFKAGHGHAHTAGGH
jgi:putative heme-binding domain-containing protein